MLTEKQRELLLLIHSRLQESGVPPSFDEMRKTLGLRSKSGVHRLVQALEERGFLRRLPRRARALEVLRLPAASPQERMNGGHLSVVNGGRAKGGNNGHHGENGSNMLNVPVMGKIAAGTPVEAIQVRLDEISVPETLLRRGEHYALEVSGDSMTGAGILEGDIALIRKTENVINGDIIVAVIDDEQATLKRLRRRGNSVALEAANPNYKTRILRPEQLAVRGKLAGIIRLY